MASARGSSGEITAGAGLGLKIGSVIGSLYAQYSNRKQRLREVSKQLQQVQVTAVRNIDAIDQTQVVIEEGVKRAQFQARLEATKIKGAVRVKAAQLGMGADATEEAVQDIQRQEGRVLSDIVDSAENAFADVRTDLEAVNLSLQNQIWGINSTVPTIDVAGAVAQLGSAGIDYAT